MNSTIWGAGALGQALAGLILSEKRMKQLSADMVAKDLPGFVRTTQEASLEYINGEAYGINQGAAQEVTNANDENNLRLAGATAKKAENLWNYMQQIAGVFGVMGSTTSLDATSNAVFTAIEAAHANGVDSAGNKKAIANAIKAHLENINSVANNLQNIRTNAENEKSKNIDEINSLLEKIASINAELEGFSEGTSNYLGSLRQRRVLIDKLAEYIPLQPVSSSGDFILQTANGRTIVHKDKAAKFLYTPQTAVNSGTSFNSIYLQTISDDPTAVGTAGGEEALAIDVTNDFNDTDAAGTLAGLTSFLQNTTASLSAYLDSYSAGFRDSMNATHNLASAITPRSSLVGTSGFIGGTSLAAGQALSAQGTLRIAVISNSSKNANYSYDLDLAAITPAAGAGTPLLVSDLVSAINNAGILSTYLTASVNGTTNSLQIALNSNYSSTHGIALGSVSGQQAAEVGVNGSANKYGFSEFFHLNDLVSATPSYYRDGSCVGLAQQISLAQLINNDNDAKALSLVKLRDDVSLGVSSQAVSSDPSTGRALMDLFNKTNTAFPASGPNSSFNGSFEGFITRILQDVSGKASTQKDEAESQKEAFKQQALAFSQEYGLSESEIATISLQISRSQDLYFNFINSYFRMMRNVAKMGTGG